MECLGRKMLAQCLSKRNATLSIYLAPLAPNDTVHSSLFRASLSITFHSSGLNIPLLQTRPSRSAQALTSE